MTLRAALVLSAALHAVLMAASFVRHEPRPEPPACVRVALAGVRGGADFSSAIPGKATKDGGASDASPSRPAPVPPSEAEPQPDRDSVNDSADAAPEGAEVVPKAVSRKVPPTNSAKVSSPVRKVPSPVRKTASRPKSVTRSKTAPAPDPVADPKSSPPQPAAALGEADSGPTKPVAESSGPIVSKSSPSVSSDVVPDTAGTDEPCTGPGRQGGADSQAVPGHGDDAHSPYGGCGPSLMAFGKDGGPDIRRRARMNYPERARRQGRQGRVLVLVHLDARGRVVDARIKSGVGVDLDRAALQFARRCTYSPAVSQGQGVACRAVLPVTFRLRE